MEPKKKKDTNELDKTGIDSQRKQTLGYQRGKGERGKLGTGNQWIHTTKHKINKGHLPRDSTSCNNL